MRAAAIVSVSLVLAACTGSTGPVASVTPARSAQPTADASPPASASPTDGVTGLPAQLSCRLPVTWGVPNGPTLTPKAGFVIFPSRTLAEDASAPPNSQFYDRAFSRWLPVGRDGVSPGGTHYAYGEGNAYQGTSGKLHVVDVATGGDTVVYSGDTVYTVVDFGADGIYVARAVPEGFPRGLLVLDPAGGQMRLISSSIVSPAVGGGAAWGLDFDTADPSPAPGGMESPMNRLLRFDLATGGSATWFYRPGANIYVFGFDAGGSPIVMADFPPAPTDASRRDMVELWLIRSATYAIPLIASSSSPVPSRLAAIDRHGIWFDSSLPTGTVWLYANQSLLPVAKVDVGYFRVAGGCIP